MYFFVLFFRYWFLVFFENKLGFLGSKKGYDLHYNGLVNYYYNSITLYYELDKHYDS
jgi:hypothetical protein